ncbi:MAG: xanthan lyase [Muribaculaceae bacterium]|nr:xanthan lyase [Muribaculaceae bacterium]
MLKNRIASVLVIAAGIMTPAAAMADDYDQSIVEILCSYLPGTTAFATPKVDSLDINDTTRNISIAFSESAAYIPLDAARLAEMKQRISDVLPERYHGYKLTLTSGDKTLDQLTLFAPKKHVRPKEKQGFVTRLDAEKAPKGLDGTNIAMWQSHGLYYQGKGEWGWQRPRLYQTCEDLFTQSFVMPFVMPMLQNAGAYVMSPRERDTSADEYIIDNDNSLARYSETQNKEAWNTSSALGFGHDGKPLIERANPFKEGSARQIKAVKSAKDASTASWNADIKSDGEYAVYVSYQSLPDSPTDAVYTVNAANGPHRFRINQRMGGGTWVYLGHFPLKAGVSTAPIVELTNVSKDKNAVVTADAVKIGGGMGNVARGTAQPDDNGVDYGYNLSGYPRFTEGARYWLQWAGAPDTVYSQTNFGNEYTDDYCSRGHWVNWLAGGSSVLPERDGLHIPVDLAFAFHSDAGITPNDSIIGTLGIYYTNNRKSYANGTARLAARDFTDLILTNIVNDVRATYEPNWTRRGMWNRNYAEARVAEVPTMLLELMSHQNFADMRYGLDPGFRFVVSRAIYKAMLQLLAQRDGRPYVVQPLPVRAFAIEGGENGTYCLTWAERVDSLESTATPTYYIIEERSGNGPGFMPVAKVTAPEYEVTVSDDSIHSYRIVAGNDGGVSFPSEVLALCYKPGKPQVTVVNGFTRVSGPYTFDYGEAAGFDNHNDPGVAYVQDISFVGDQFEFRRDISWMTNETCGMGASRNDYEDKVVAGNTFDYTAVHGASIAKAGYGFVSTSMEAFVASDSHPAIVDLIFGTQKELTVGTGAYGTRFKTFTAPLQERLTRLAQGGTGIIATGAYIATDLWANPYSSEATAKADQEFANNVLGYTWRSGKATEYGEIEGVKNRFGLLDNLDLTFQLRPNADCYAVSSPGAIAPSDAKAGATVMKYSVGNLPAATAFAPSTHKVFAMGIPFEAISDTSARDVMMKAILTFVTSK